MNNRLVIGGEDADTVYNLRTTESILLTLREEAHRKKISINLLINKIIYPATRKIKEREFKKAITNYKKEPK